jgi:hypothetical protein
MMLAGGACYLANALIVRAVGREKALAATVPARS